MDPHQENSGSGRILRIRVAAGATPDLALTTSDPGSCRSTRRPDCSSWRPGGGLGVRVSARVLYERGPPVIFALDGVRPCILSRPTDG